MVGPVVWVQPWLIITISFSALFVTIIFVLYCICWGQKKSSSRFYILDETGFKTSSMSEFAQNSLNNLRLFRRLSGSKEAKNDIFTSKHLPFYKMEKDLLSELDLMDPLDASQSFENSTLQLENDSQTTPRELLSCISTDSQHSYYSTLPALGRSNSRGTFLSIEFGTDTETLID